MILDFIATALLGWFLYRNVRGGMEVFGGPYEGKGILLLITLGQIIAAGFILWRVWA